MITMANNRTAAERRAIAEFLTGKSLSKPLVTTPPRSAMCTASPGGFNPASGPRWTAGDRTRTTRASRTRRPPASPPATCPAEAEMGVRVSRRSAVLRAGHDRRRTRVRRQLGRQGLFARAPPRAASTGSSTPARACARRSASDVVGTRDDRGLRRLRRPTLYALDAATGRLLWKTDVDDFPVGRISGSPTLHNGRIYVGVASGEEGLRRDPDLRVLPVPRQRGRARCGDGQAALEDLHDRRAEADEEERRRHAALGTVGRAGLVGARRSTRSSIACT